MDKKIQRTGGSFKISNEVIEKIVELAATEISGVASNNQKLELPENPVNIINKLSGPIKVRLTNEACEIDLSIIVIQGHKAVNVAESVQASVKSAVQNMTGIPVSKVNVKVVGIKASANA